MIDIPTYLAAVTQVASITKALLNARSEAEAATIRVDLSGAVLDLQSKVSEMQATYSQLLDANESLKRQLAEYQGWEKDRSRYSMRELSPGIIAYCINQEDRDGEPVHWLCAACYNQSKKSVLILEHINSGVYVCPSNRNHNIDLNEYG